MVKHPIQAFTALLVLGLVVPACAGEPVHGDTGLLVGPPPGATLVGTEAEVEAEGATPVAPGATVGMLAAGQGGPEAGAGGAPDLPKGVVSVDPAVQFQTVRGFGGQADYQLLGPPGRADGVTRADYDHVLRECVVNGVTWARVGLPSWEDRNDDGASGTADHAYFEEQFAYHYPGLVEHLTGLRNAGIEPLVVFWGFPDWMFGPDGKLKPGILPELVENCAVLLAMLQVRGVPVRYFSLVNEPPWGKTIGDPDTFAEAVALLGARLKEMKLDMHIVAPDLAGDIRRLAGGWVEPLLTKAAPYVDALAFHGYQFSMEAKPEDLVPFHAALRGQIENRGAGGRTPEIWYTEYNGHWFGNADEDRRAENGPCDSWEHGIKVAELTHYLLASGVSLSLLWELYDVRRAVEERVPKRWGTMKYKTEEWAKRPEYQTFGMYSRFIRPGYRIVGCRASRAGAPLAVAALGPGELVVVLTNPRTAPDTADIVAGVEPAGATAEVWLTTRRVPFAVSYRPIRTGRIWVDLPPLSMATVRVPLKR
ncbi:MAG: hypothetical protein AAB152_03420 [Candidatus Coatesbacteria bacterium]